MASLVGTLLRAASRKEGEPLNILTFPTHERYETGLCLTGHNFYAYRGEGIKDWNTGYAPLPANYTLLPPGKEPPLDIDFDIILSQNKFGQYAIARYFSKLFHCPLISLEHTLPPQDWGPDVLAQFQQMKGDVNIFISEYSVKQWGYPAGSSVVIHHGIDTKLFQPLESNNKRQPLLLSVVNDWINRDWCCGFKLWQEISKDLPIAVLGDTPGLSKKADSVEQLALHYSNSLVFLNTSLISPVPTALLEAMSCGCAVVSTATCMIPEIIINGVNGFVSNNPTELRQYCEMLLKNPKLAKRLGEAGRRTILDRFSMDKFVKNWQNILSYTADQIFVMEQ